MEEGAMVGLRALERIHGHVGWLAAAALAHPALLLRTKRRPTGAVLAAAGLATAAAALGAGVYPAYRRHVRPDLFTLREDLGWMFERKEHLAFGVVLLSWAGAVAYLADGRTEAAGAAAPSLRRFAQLAFAAACVLATVVAILGTWIATVQSF